MKARTSTLQENWKLAINLQQGARPRSSVSEEAGRKYELGAEGATTTRTKDPVLGGVTQLLEVVGAAGDTLGLPLRS